MTLRSWPSTGSATSTRVVLEPMSIAAQSTHTHVGRGLRWRRPFLASAQVFWSHEIHSLNGFRGKRPQLPSNSNVASAPVGYLRSSFSSRLLPWREPSPAPGSRGCGRSASPRARCRVSDEGARGVRQPRRRRAHARPAPIRCPQGPARCRGTSPRPVSPVSRGPVPALSACDADASSTAQWPSRPAAPAGRSWSASVGSSQLDFACRRR